MTEETGRKKALISMRRRDRAEALVELKAALQAADKTSAEIANNEDRIKAIESRLHKTSCASVVNAGRLARSMESRRLLENALMKHRRTEALLEKENEQANEKVDEAKDNLTKAHNALKLASKMR